MERIPYLELIMRLTVISDELSSAQMITTLDIVPNRAWDIGDFRPQTRCKEKNNGIIIDSGIERKGSIEEHTEAITAKLEPLRSALLDLSENCEISLSVVYYSTYCNPRLWFDNSFMSLLASINASLEMDGYVFDSENEEKNQDENKL